MILYESLKSEYGENEPILLQDIRIEGMSDVNLRQQIKKLTDSGRLKRFDSGVYFIPQSTMFRSGSQLSREKVIEKKYLQEGDARCGYIGGIAFANQLGITTQVPMVYDITTNKATRDYRETTLAGTRIILRKPCVTITESNYKALKFLDLLKNIDFVSEVTGMELKNKLLGYMRETGLTFNDLEQFMSYYPDKLYRNMYKVRILHGLSA